MRGRYTAVLREIQHVPAPVLEVEGQTKRFNYTEVKPHFINPCCFGEDFAEWLAAELAPLKPAGYEISVPIQEDYGWGLWASKEKATIWIAISAVQGDRAGEKPAHPPLTGEWMLTVVEEFGLNPLRRLFGRPSPTVAAAVARAVREL
jgi:hypothetical protein